jgi:hypothetical protein
VQVAWLPCNQCGMPCSATAVPEKLAETSLKIFSTRFACIVRLGLADLAKTTSNFATGWTCANGNRTELFFGGRAMTLARYPNKETGSEIWQYLRQGDSLTNSSFAAGTDDTTGDKPIAASLSAQWRTETDTLWAHGFWSWDWAGEY